MPRKMAIPPRELSRYVTDPRDTPRVRHLDNYAGCKRRCSSRKPSLSAPLIHYRRAEYQTGQDFRKRAQRCPLLAVVRARAVEYSVRIYRGLPGPPAGYRKSLKRIEMGIMAARTWRIVIPSRAGFSRRSGRLNRRRHAFLNVTNDRRRASRKKQRSPGSIEARYARLDRLTNARCKEAWRRVNCRASM